MSLYLIKCSVDKGRMLQRAYNFKSADLESGKFAESRSQTAKELKSYENRAKEQYGTVRKNRYVTGSFW